jgi:hypothetical protein
MIEYMGADSSDRDSSWKLCESRSSSGRVVVYRSPPTNKFKSTAKHCTEVLVRLFVHKRKGQ